MPRLFINMGRMETAKVIQMNVAARLQFFTDAFREFVDKGVCFNTSDLGSLGYQLRKGVERYLVVGAPASFDSIS